MSSDEAIEALATAYKSKTLTSSTCYISTDKTTLHLHNQSFPATLPCTIQANGSSKIMTYPLLSIYLQILDPNISLVKYRKICGDYQVDTIKVTDKKAMVEYFTSGANDDEEEEEEDGLMESQSQTQPMTGTMEGEEDDRMDLDDDDQEDTTRDREKDRRHRHREDGTRDKSSRDKDRKRKDRDRHSSSSRKEKKKRYDDDREKDRHSRHKSSNKDRSGSSKDKHHDSLSSAKKEKKEKAPMTQDQLVSNLDVIVDKRLDKTKNDEYQQAIISCLSAKGYMKTQADHDMIEKDRAQVEKITSMEIPVGNTASALRCGAPAAKPVEKKSSKSGRNNKFNASDAASMQKKDFSHTLKLFVETIAAEKSKEKKRGKGASDDKAKDKKPKGKPIIIIPNAMTSAINIVNAKPFFDKSKYMTRKEVMQQNPQMRQPKLVEVQRQLTARYGGRLMEYEIIDNPTRILQKKEDWDRVVAVLAQGASWQFKDWKMGERRNSSRSAPDPDAPFSSTPVDVFSNAFGFYIGFEGSPIPSEIKGWDVKLGMISKDKRGLDSAVCAAFWNGLDEWMNVHKRGFLNTQG